MPFRLLNRIAQALDEIGYLAVAGRKAGQLLCILQRGIEIAGVAVEANEGQQRIAIGWVAGQRLLEHGDRLLAAPGRVQGDRIDIGGESSGQGRATSNSSTFPPPAICGRDGSKPWRRSRFTTSERARTKASFRVVALRSATLKKASPK